MKILFIELILEKNLLIKKIVLREEKIIINNYE